MKPYQRLLLIFILSLALVAILGPFLKMGVDAFVLHSDWLARKLRFHDGSYQYGKVNRRLLMAILFVLLVAYRKPLQLVPLVTVGFRPRAGWWRQTAFGFGLAVVFLSLFCVVVAMWGAWHWDVADKSAGKLMGALVGFLIAAAFIGLSEEVLFRGFLLQSLMQGFSTATAVAISSAIYSLMHFLMLSSARSGESILRSCLGLFLLGLVLSYAYLRTRRLYLSMGIHAGLVFAVKAQTSWGNRVPDAPGWLFGGHYVTGGVLGWALLLLMAVAVHWATRPPPPHEGVPNSVDS